ncbi:DUF5391 family protein [Thermoflavimicrobium daqui]|jgi:hypothetical protein|uniref:DUF5391 family protein n=1 Tax=Thermoflavimicrobium daqui TaxID=2137476 RepID=A0A364K0W6_9BACL|nr:DUF5391 family protein [Thermoflavimicrobium daqui]RAL21038.1 hypothetical protein DL897_17550 [Thermoflavimicrobium daqui]
MTNKAKKYGIFFMTLTSALLFCTMLVIASLSPLAELGPNANQFGSFGMWSAIGIVLLFYILPLIFYMVGINVMRYVMAFFCGLGLLMILTVFVVILILDIPVSLGVIVICIASSIANAAWFFVAFRSYKS